MNTYTINSTGQYYVGAFVRDNAIDGIRVVEFFTDAESAANDAFDCGMTATLELGRRYSWDDQPHVLTLDQAWFDAVQS